jgi:integrase
VRRGHGPKLTKSFSRKSEAEEWARSIEHKLDVGDHVPNSEARKRSLGDAIGRYLEVTLPRAKHRKNAAEQTRLLGWWKAEHGARALVGITPNVLAEARDALASGRGPTKAHLSGATCNRYLSAISAVLTTAEKEWGWISRNPLANVKRFEDSRERTRFLSDDERARLLKKCDESALKSLRTVVELALATGARQGELMYLDWECVNLKRRTVRFVDTKNGDDRTVPLAPVAIRALKAWQKESSKEGRVFPYSAAQLNKFWFLARDATDLSDVRFHDLRHSAASYLAMSGASPLDIAAILGHRTLAMVKRYSHLSEQHTTAAIDRMAEKFLSKESGKAG